MGEGLAHSVPGRCRALQFLAALLSECELLAARTCLVMLPGVLEEALVFQSLQEGVQRSALKAGEAMLPEDLDDGVAMAFPVSEHCEYCLRERRPSQLLVKVDSLHK